jgi:hypothetical protein
MLAVLKLRIVCSDALDDLDATVDAGRTTVRLVFEIVRFANGKHTELKLMLGC